MDAGEIVEVLRKHDSGWWEGRVVGAGVERKGWFPEVNVNSEVEVQHVSSRGHVAAGSGAAAASSPVKTAEKRCVVNGALRNTATQQGSNVFADRFWTQGFSRDVARCFKIARRAAARLAADTTEGAGWPCGRCSRA